MHSYEGPQKLRVLYLSATHCNTLQHTATHTYKNSGPREIAGTAPEINKSCSNLGVGNPFSAKTSYLKIQGLKKLRALHLSGNQKFTSKYLWRGMKVSALSL